MVSRAAAAPAVALLLLLARAVIGTLRRRQPALLIEAALQRPMEGVDG
jgi:hypothetical protein